MQLKTKLNSPHFIYIYIFEMILKLRLENRTVQTFIQRGRKGSVSFPFLGESVRAIPTERRCSLFLFLPWWINTTLLCCCYYRRRCYCCFWKEKRANKLFAFFFFSSLPLKNSTRFNGKETNKERGNESTRLTGTRPAGNGSSSSTAITAENKRKDRGHSDAV